MVFSVWSVQSGYKEELSRELNRAFGVGNWQNIGKKGIRRRKEDSMCETGTNTVLKSVARIRLVKTENPSVCATVNGKVCRSTLALYYF
jgi:hypothetical protein